MAMPPGKELPFPELLHELKAKCGDTKVGTVRAKLKMPKLLEGKAHDDDDLARKNHELTKDERVKLTAALEGHR